MMFRPKAKNAIGKLVGKGKYKAPVLQITLEHGDIVIMHGELIQKLYEVSLRLIRAFDGSERRGKY